MPIQKDKLHDQVYNRLCTMLRQGEFTPGEPVPVAHIADAFGISPMPVREALTRLLAKGVLTNVSGRSVGVPKVSLENLTDVRDVRLEVESVAVEWSIKNSDEKFIKDLKKLFEGLVDAEKRKDVRDFIRLNSATVSSISISFQKHSCLFSSRIKSPLTNDLVLLVSLSIFNLFECILRTVLTLSFKSFREKGFAKKIER